MIRESSYILRRIFLILFLFMLLLAPDGDPLPNQPLLPPSNPEGPDVDPKPTKSGNLGLLEHAPVAIAGDKDFRDKAVMEQWPGNGTKNRPYLIQDLSIMGFSNKGLIRIVNVNLYFRILNNTLSGGYIGIYLLNVKHGVIEKNILTDNEYGVQLLSSDNTTLIDNTIANNSYGVWSESSLHVVLRDNIIRGNRDGIYMHLSGESNLSRNIIAQNRLNGIYMSLSGGSTLNSNQISYNTAYGLILVNSWQNFLVNNLFVANGLNLYGQQVEAYLQRLVSNNTVNGKPLVLWQNRENAIVPADAGQVILVNSSGSRVVNQVIENASIGVFAVYSSSLIIQNVTSRSNSRFGLFLYQSPGAYISQIFASSNRYGAQLSYSGNSTIRESTFTSNLVYGIRLDFSGHSSLFNNLVSHSQLYGIWFSSSPENRVKGNSLTHTGLFISGRNYYEFTQGEVVGNMVNKNSLVFLQDAVGGTILSGTAGQVFLLNSTQISVVGQNLSHTTVGVAVFYSSKISVTNNTMIHNSIAGISLFRSSNSEISLNSISFNAGNGIYLVASSSTTVSGNIISANDGAGIYVYLTDQSLILSNIILNNTSGIFLYSSNEGVIEGNLMQTNQGEGILLLLASETIIRYNNLSRNLGYGIYLGHSTKRNQVRMNNFMENNRDGSSQAYDSFVVDSNQLYSSNTFQSNYWDDWVTSDESYSIDGPAENQDNTPRLEPVQGKKVPSLLNSGLFLGFAIIAGLGSLMSLFWAKSRINR